MSALFLGACAAGDPAARGSGGNFNGAGGTNALISTGGGSPISTGAGGTFSMVCGPGGTKTTVSGTVYDPAGKVPLYNVVLYVPLTSELPAISEGASCEACGGRTAKAAAVALSDSSGHFVLEDVPEGQNIPLVIEIGRWRRQVVIPSVKGCQDNKLDDPNLTRLPRNSTEGHIPKIAVSTGHSDALECLLRKIGIDENEFATSSGPGRVHMYRGCIDSKGVQYPASKFAPNLNGGATFPTTNELFASGLDPYDMVVFSCEGHKCTDLQTSANIVKLNAYEDKGGRVFLDHVHYNWLNHADAPIESAAQFSSGSDPTTPLPTQIDQSFPKGKAFAEWLLAVKASKTLGDLDIVQAQNSCTGVTDGLAQRWIYSDSPTGNFYVTINTPVPKEGMQLDACGRVVFTDLHVSGAVMDFSHEDTPFPGGCVSTEISPQEKALEFMLFDLSSCVQKETVAPEPPDIAK